MAILAYAAWVMQINRRVAEEEGRFERAGYSLDVRKANEHYPDVPDADNAAPVILAAATNMAFVPPRLVEQIHEYETETNGTVSWSKAHQDHVAEFVESQLPFLEALAPALDLPESRYPIDLSAAYDVRLPHLKILRDAAEAAHRALGLSVYDNNTEEAVYLVRVLAMLGNSLRKEPLIISQFNRANLDQLTADATLELLHAGILSDEQLTAVQESLEPANDVVSAADVLAIEVASGYSYFRHPDRWGRAGYSGNSTIGNLCYVQLPFLGRAFDVATRKYSRARYEYLHYMNGLLDAASKPWPLAAREIRLWSDEFFSTRRIDLVTMMIPAIGRFHENMGEACAIRAALLNAVLVERFRVTHGRLPDTLDEVAARYPGDWASDPLSGQPFVYLRNGAEIRIYSPGVDGIDNGANVPAAPWAVIDRAAADAGVMVELGTSLQGQTQ
jgi:hypothetical protein